MTYRPVVDRFVAPVALDPPSAALFVAIFIAVALLTARRPAYGLCALVLTAPIAFAHEVLGTSITLAKVALLGVLLGLSTYAGAFATLRNRRPAMLLGALALVLIATLLSASEAVAREAVLREGFKVVEYAALFVAAFVGYRLDADDAALRNAVAIAAIAVALSALVQEFIGAPSGLYIGSAVVPRIAGLLEGPNQLAGYCEIAVAALGAWTFVARSALIDVALALAVCAEILSFSRAGWAALAVVGVVLAVAGGRRAWSSLRRGLYGLIAGLAGGAWWAIYARTPAVLRASFEPSMYAGGVGNRGELWHAAWRMWLSHSLFGVGAGNFELLLASYGVFGIRTHANSWYLQALAEGGILLAAATIGLLAAIFIALTGFPRVARLRSASPWVVAAIAATLALALHQIVDYLIFYPKVGGAWWILIGVGVAAVS
ncbi:MAG: O-antigen ligase family protein [Candidatus Eremiobacteraeota bacterium]|nr:O-antigen ligase family protein [Candidatus Eremiobacteraeota bacterium]